MREEILRHFKNLLEMVWNCLYHLYCILIYAFPWHCLKHGIQLKMSTVSAVKLKGE